MLYEIGVTLLLLAVVLAAAGHGADVSFEEVCVPAKALGLAGRDMGSVAVLAWHRGEPMHLPWRVAAVEMDVIPLVNVTDVDRYAFRSHALPPRLEDNTLVCISLPDRTERPPARAKRGGEVYKIGGRYVVISNRDPLDPPPAPVVAPRPSAVEVRKVGRVDAVEEEAPLQAQQLTGVRTISGGFKSRYLTNASLAPNGFASSLPIDLPNGTRYLYIYLTNVTQPGRYRVVAVVADAQTADIYFNLAVDVAVDGRSPYYFVMPIPVVSWGYSRQLRLTVGVRNLDSAYRSVDVVVVGVFDASRHMDNRWAAGMRAVSSYGFRYASTVRSGVYAAIPIHIPPGGVHGTEEVRVKVRAVICSSVVPSSFTADVYIRPFWIGSVTFYYSYSSGGCAYYRTVDVTFRPSLLPLPYALLGTTDLAIGPLPQGTSFTVYELYVAGMRRPEFNRPASPAFLSAKWLDATYVMNGVLRIEAEPDLHVTAISGIHLRLTLSPIVTPSGVVPLPTGEHVVYTGCLGLPNRFFAVEGRGRTLTDELLTIVRYTNAALSALGFVVDRYAQDPKVRTAYRVVTFAGRVAESALSGAKTTLSTDGCTVKINVGWEERTNVVLARLYYPMSRAVDSYELVLGSYSVVGLAEHLYLEVYSTFSAYPVDSSVDLYSTWHCLYQQQPPSRTCDPSRYR
jgi:hypothetical protein